MKFIKDIKKPINIVTLIIGIVAIALTIISLILSSKSSELSYSIEPTIKIIDSKLKGSKIRVFDDNNKEIKSDIYSTSVIIWNSGDLPINIEDIRIIPSIKFNGISQILSFPTIKESGDYISKFRLIKDSTKKKTYKLKWKYFDPNKAVRINILYTIVNDNKYHIEINGNILGINGFHKVNYDRNDDKTYSKIKLVVLSIIFLGFIVLTIDFLFNIIKSNIILISIRILYIIGFLIFISFEIFYLPNIPIF